MAKPPCKRRGIMLNPRADSATSLDLLSVPPAITDSVASGEECRDAESSSAGGNDIPAAMSEAFVELRRVSNDLDDRWLRQAKLLEEQSRQLEQQREEIAAQTCQLKALERSRRASGRVGVLLALLAISSVGALGFHTWPQLQYLAGDLGRMSTDVAQLAPQVRDVRGKVTSLTSNLGQMGGIVESLEEDVSAARSELGSLRQAVDRLPKSKVTVQASTRAERGTPRTSPRAARAITTPYRSMYPMRPW